MNINANPAILISLEQGVKMVHEVVQQDKELAQDMEELTIGFVNSSRLNKINSYTQTAYVIKNKSLLSSNGFLAF